MAADAERVEKAATTCVVIHKKGIYSMILKKKRKAYLQSDMSDIVQCSLFSVSFQRI